MVYSGAKLFVRPNGSGLVKTGVTAPPRGATGNCRGRGSSGLPTVPYCETSCANERCGPYLTITPSARTKNGNVGENRVLNFYESVHSHCILRFGYSFISADNMLFRAQSHRRGSELFKLFETGYFLDGGHFKERENSQRRKRLRKSRKCLVERA